MAMISAGDESARNAFRAFLRDDASQSSVASLVTQTQEIDAADILEVKNLASAIARAELALHESSRPRSSRDMFADLGIPTDDCSGPAVYVAPRVTPVPPAKPSTTAKAEPARAATLLFAHEPLVDPIDDDAYLQPAGRMRSMADVTLDGVRLDSTLEVALQNRRSRLGRIVAGAVAALAVIAIAALAVPRAPASAIAPVTEGPVASPARVEVKVETAKVAPAAVEPVMNVNSLPTAAAGAR